MEITATERRPRRSPRWRHLASVLAAMVVAASALIATQPAAAEDPWLTQLGDGYVRFTIPNAGVEAAVGPVSQVVVEGNFAPSANWGQIGLSRSGANWSTTFGPLDPGLYHYQVTGDDSKVMKDPTNPTTVASEPEWSTFFVPGDSAALLADAPEEAGTIETLAYHSDVAGEDRSALVWTPPGYETQGEPYPVLYLQHGGGQGYRDWTEVGRAEQILDNLSLSGELADMIVVMGDGNVPDFSTELFDNLMPAVREAYHVSNAKKDRALAGLSMGGGQAFGVLRSHPGEFAYVGTFGAGLFGDVSNLPVEEINELTTLFRLYVGNKTDIAYNHVFDSLQQFDALGLDYQFDGVNPDAGHNWNAWQENLIDFAPRLFHGKKQTGDPGFSEGHTALEERFDPPAPGTTPTPWITEDGFVTFETTSDFADADFVSVWANWGPGGSWVRVEATKVGDRWRATVGPLDPWSYYYRLIVDRVSVKDASNPTKVTSEPAWSTFFIPGEEARLLADVPEGEGGTLGVLAYQSAVTGGERSAYVWTPPGYDPDRAEPYPLFVLNHGGGQSWTDWVEVGRARQILDNLTLDGAAEPMVVVMPNGNVSNFNAEVLGSLLPAAEATYHLSTDPAQRGMAGLSAGGARTAGMLKANPGAFADIGLFSAGFGSTTGIDVEAINTGTRMLRMYVGDITDFVYPSAIASMAQMEAAGIEFEFDGITPGPHGWDVWQKNLIDFAPRLFHDAQ